MVAPVEARLWLVEGYSRNQTLTEDGDREDNSRSDFLGKGEDVQP